MPAAELSDVGLSDVSMQVGLHRANFNASENVCAVRNVFFRAISHNGGMTKPWPNHISVWRKKAGLTMEQLAARMDPPSSKGMISQYESGKRRPRQETLAAIAQAVGTTPGNLLDERDDDDDDVAPSVDVLRQMIAEVIDAELRMEHRISDLPRIVAPALHEQLERWRSDARGGALAGEGAAPDTDAQPPKPTKPAGKAGSRTA